MDGGKNIDLAKFNFNVDDIVKGAAVLKSTIDQIKKQQAELRKDGKTSTVGFIENEAALKTLNKEYRQHIKALSDTQKAAQQAAVREQLLEGVLGKEVKTIKEAREQNKILNDLRNEANTTTEEGQAEIAKLNAQLDRNNELVKDNADAYLKQKINIGNYREEIVGALQDLNLFEGGIGNVTTNFVTFISKSKEAGGGASFLGKSLKTATSGLISLTKAALGFILTPIGAIIALLAGAFLLVQNAMNRSEEATNKIKRAFAPFQGILDAVLGALEPVGGFLIDGIVMGLELAEKAIYTAIDAFATLAEFLGFDDLAKSAREFNQEIQQGAKDAQALADAEAALTKQQREARLVQLQYQKEAEQFRQIRDDENRSIAERIQANEQLGAVLEQQLQDELRIAQTALEVANLRLKAEGESQAVLDAQASALENIADIEERITGQRSEQLTNRVSLEREAEQKRQEAIDKRIEKMNEEIALFIAQQGVRARTLQEELELEREVARQKQEILDEELRNKRISQEAYQTEVLNLRNELARREAEITVDNASREIDQYRKQLAQRQEENKFLSDQVVAQKIAENNALLQKELDFQELRRAQGVVDENEFNLAIEEAKEINRIANKEIEDERKAVEKEEALELRALEFEEELERLLEEGATKNEILKAQQEEQRAVDTARVQQERDQGLISEELYQARLSQIDRRAKQQELQRERILAEQKLNIATGLLSAAAQVINKDSAAGKAIALAQAGINTYQGIAAGVKLGYPAAIPAVAAAAATGFKAVKDIASTKVPSAAGGGNVSGGGGSVPGGGAQGIGGVNLGSATNLSDIAASGNAAVQDTLDQAVGGRNIAEEVGRAAEEGTRRGSERGANEGITNLTENRQIQENSQF